NLYEFLEQPKRTIGGAAREGTRPGDGLRLEHVSFTYAGASAPAIDDVSLHLRPGEKLALVGENGAGKTTLIKLIAGLYEPERGRVLYDGRDVRDWSPAALHARIGVIFQDFVRYQLLLGENIGAGDVAGFEDEERWRIAGERGMADVVATQL